MQKLGCFLLILGAGSLILPFLGVQFRLMSLFGDATPIVGIVIAVIGVVLIVVSSAGKKAPSGASVNTGDKQGPSSP